MQLKELREKSGYLQSDIAKAIGVNNSTYAYYEREEHNPSPQMLWLLADFFDVTVDEILGRGPQQQLFDDARVSQPEIMRLYNVMNELQQIELVSYARGMLARAASSADEQQNYTKNLRA